MNKKELKAMATREDYTLEDSLATLELLDTELGKVHKKHKPSLIEPRDTIGERNSVEQATIGIGFTASFLSFSSLFFGGLATGDVALLAWSGLGLVGFAGFGHAAGMPNYQFERLLKKLRPKEYARRLHAYNQSMKAFSDAETAYRTECAPYIKAVEVLAKSFHKHFPDRELVLNKNNEIEVVERSLTSIQKLMIEQKRIKNNVAEIEWTDREKTNA